MKLSKVFIMLLMTPSLLFAADATNSVYIDQIGDSSTITINQKGQSNVIGSEANRFQFQGDSQTVLINQNGVGNSIQGSIVQGDNVTETQNYVGDNNSVTFDEGSGASVEGSTRTLTVTGDSNTLVFNQGTLASSTDATQTINVTGDLNTYTSTINANDVTNTVDVTGSSNQVTMVQNGYAGKNVDLDITGNSNTYTINQTSVNNVDTLKISTTGSNTTVHINQCNAGGQGNGC
jgi:hypothetical protein